MQQGDNSDGKSEQKPSLCPCTQQGGKDDGKPSLDKPPRGKTGTTLLHVPVLSFLEALPSPCRKSFTPIFLRVCLSNEVGADDKPSVYKEIPFIKGSTLSDSIKGCNDTAVKLFGWEEVDFSQLPSHLQKLRTEACNSLALADHVGHLTALRKLNCVKLDAIPDKLSSLTMVEDLRFKNCSGPLPCEISTLTGLHTLTLESCRGISTLPAMDNNMDSLVLLSLKGCSLLRELPSQWSSLTNLRSLALQRCFQLSSLPTGLSGLSRLESLNLALCKSLEELPPAVMNGLSSLQSLNLAHCSSLSVIPDEICQSNLRSLRLNGCSRISGLPSTLSKLEKGLKLFDLQHCHQLEALPKGIAVRNYLDLGGCAIETLNGSILSELHTLKLGPTIPNGVEGLTSLHILEVRECLRLQELLSAVTNMTNLHSLVLGECTGLESLPSNIFDHVSSLTVLNLEGCTNLKSLPSSLEKLKLLSSLNLRWCESLASLPASIGSLKSLCTLDLRWCYSLTELPYSVSKLVNLKVLHLSWCNALSSLPREFGYLSKLKRLCLSWCGAVQSLPASFGQLSNLEALQMSHCVSLTRLPVEIGILSSLKSLCLSWCSALKHLPTSIGQLSNLETLHVSHCACLSSLPHEIGQLFNLKSLSLSWCPLLESLPTSLGQLSQLEELHMRQCVSLMSIPDEIGKLSNLKSLSFSWCHLLERLPTSLGQLSNLEDLHMTHCVSLASLPNELGKLSQLRKLCIANCSGLTDLPRELGNLELDSFDCEGLLVKHHHFLQDNCDNWSLLQAYFLSLAEAKPLYCHRFLLIGDGGSGKTTLAKVLSLLVNSRQPTSRPSWLARLFHRTVDDKVRREIDGILREDYASTHGSHRIDLRIPIDFFDDGANGHLDLRLIDFAGQMEYLHTHWLFFTQMNSIYVIVAPAVNGKKKEPSFSTALSSARRWLGLLNGAGAGAIRAHVVAVNNSDCNLSAAVKPNYSASVTKGSDLSQPVVRPLVPVETLASVAVTKGTTISEPFENYFAQRLASDLQNAGLPCLASCSLLNYDDIPSLRQCMADMLKPALDLRCNAIYPPSCSIVLAAVQKQLYDQQAEEAHCPLVPAGQILAATGCDGDVIESEFEIGLRILHSIGEVVLVKPHEELTTRSWVVLDPLGWLSSTVALFVRREDQADKLCQADKKRIVLWGDNPTHSSPLEPKRWGWIKRVMVEAKLKDHKNDAGHINLIISLLLEWNLCFEDGEYLVWPMRFTTAKPFDSDSSDLTATDTLWTSAMALESMMVKNQDPLRRIQGVLLTSAGDLLKIPPALFSTVVVQMCSSHNFRPHQELESFQEQVLLCRGMDMVLLMYSLEESYIRVVCYGRRAARVALEIVAAFKKAQQRHFSFATEWMYGIMCGHCLIKERKVENATPFRAELKRGKSGKLRWIVASPHCDTDPSTINDAELMERVLQGYPVAEEKDIVNAILSEQPGFADFIRALLDTREGVVSKSRTWVSRASLEATLNMFSAVVRIEVDGFYGTAFLAKWNQDLYLVTACHVLRNLRTVKSDSLSVDFLYFRVGKTCQFPLGEVVEIENLKENKALDVALFPVTNLPPQIKEEVSVFELTDGEIAQNEKVCVIHHAKGEIAGADMGAKVTKVLRDRIYYSLETDEGASGAPVFAARQGRVDVVAVHSGAGKKNYGAPIARVIEWL